MDLQFQENKKKLCSLLYPWNFSIEQQEIPIILWDIPRLITSSWALKYPWLAGIKYYIHEGPMNKCHEITKSYGNPINEFHRLFTLFSSVWFHSLFMSLGYGLSIGSFHRYFIMKNCNWNFYGCFNGNSTVKACPVLFV